MNDLHLQAPAPSWRQIEKPLDDELLVVVGPTATGKTELGIRLAETFDGEIIGADSVQIYRDYDIGSGKPTAEEKARAKAAKEAEKKRQKDEAEIDSELAALKRKMGK